MRSRDFPLALAFSRLGAMEKTATQASNFPNRIRTHECSRINHIVLCCSEQFIADITPYFLTVFIGLAVQGFARSYNAIFLGRCCLISKRKQHTFGTFGQINKLQGKQ